VVACLGTLLPHDEGGPLWGMRLMRAQKQGYQQLQQHCMNKVRTRQLGRLLPALLPGPCTWLIGGVSDTSCRRYLLLTCLPMDTVVGHIACNMRTMLHFSAATVH
jgi:hypothetical protein